MASETARSLADLLLENERAARPGASPETAPVNACTRLNAELCRWVGSIGCHTLFTRALRSAQAEYRGLAALTLRPGREPPLRGIEHVVAQIGSKDSAVALEALLVSLIDLLERFIGADIVGALVQRSLVEISDDATVHKEGTEDGEG